MGSESKEGIYRKILREMPKQLKTANFVDAKFANNEVSRESAADMTPYPNRGPDQVGPEKIMTITQRNRLPHFSPYPETLMTPEISQ